MRPELLQQWVIRGADRRGDQQPELSGRQVDAEDLQQEDGCDHLIESGSIHIHRRTERNDEL